MIFLPETEEIIISGGDGKIKKLIRKTDGNDILQVEHTMINEATLPGQINSMSLTSDKKEIVCVSTTGKIFRVLIPNLDYILHSTSHSSSINDIAFNEYGKINDICYTVDDHGNLFEYDLNDFNVLGIIPANDDENANSVNIPKATSVYIGDDESIYIGYSNGNLKNFSKDLSLKLFDIPKHKGNINCIYVDGNYILTGGEDGIIRVWTRRTHELIIQVPAHHSNVRCLFADINSPNLIYSCGDDRELVCFDLKLQKRQNNQSINNGYLTGISQKIDKEYEIISCGINCNLYVWDFCKTQPIREINLNENMMAVKISHNGKFFDLGSSSRNLDFFFT